MMNDILRAGYELAIKNIPLSIPDTSFFGSISNSFETELKKSMVDSSSCGIEDIISEAAAKYNLSKDLIKKIISHESGFNSSAVSSCGASGLMQLMPDTARAMGVNDIFNPYENIMGGCKYLRTLLNQFKDAKLAVAAYDCGPGNIEKYGGIPPITETINYVNSIFGA